MTVKKPNPFLRFVVELFHRVAVMGGAVTLTFLFFLILPLMQTISKPPAQDQLLVSVNTGMIEPPPPPPEPEQEEEPEPEESEPDLVEDAQPLDLASLELAMSPGFGGGWSQGDFQVNIATAAAGDKNVDELFSLADLDQKPRVVYQPGPTFTAALRKKAPGTVYVIFIVDRDGRVADAKVQRSSDPAFEQAAVSAVKKWRFEPGKRKGEPVRFRMRVPITFPKP